MKSLSFSTYFLLLLFVLPSLIFTQTSVEDIKRETTSECTNPSHKHYPLITLGYITPWNKEGYKMVEKYHNKFDIVSPTWFELVPETLNGEFNLKIDGTNNIDMNYLSTIKSKNPKISIMPRFYCSSLKQNDYLYWFNERYSPKFLRILIRRLKHNKFDGMVLDCIQIWLVPQFLKEFKSFLPKLSDELHKVNMKLIVTLLPESGKVTNLVDKKEFSFLSEYIDNFNIMTYDYMQYHPFDKKAFENDEIYNAPLSWVKSSIEHYVDLNNDDNESNDDNKSNDNNNQLLLKKILLGLPFHGYIFNMEQRNQGGVLDSAKFYNLVDSSDEKSLKWSESECEHLVSTEQNGGHIFAVYPTRKFLRERLEWSKEISLGGCGVWDIGNGNSGFMDEF